MTAKPWAHESTMMRVTKDKKATEYLITKLVDFEITFEKYPIIEFDLPYSKYRFDDNSNVKYKVCDDPRMEDITDWGDLGCFGISLELDTCESFITANDNTGNLKIVGINIKFGIHLDYFQIEDYELPEMLDIKNCLGQKVKLHKVTVIYQTTTHQDVCLVITGKSGESYVTFVKPFHTDSCYQQDMSVIHLSNKLIGEHLTKHKELVETIKSAH